MKIEIEKIGQAIFIAENDSDQAIIDHWDGKYFLLNSGSRTKNKFDREEEKRTGAGIIGGETEVICFTELQTIKDIESINNINN